MANVVEFIYRLQDRVSGTMEKVARSAERVQGQMAKTQQQTERLGNSIGDMATQYLSFAAAAMAGRAFIKMGMDMEQTRIKFEVMLGTAERGNRMIAEINRMADATPFQNVDLQKATETLLGFNYSADKVLPTLSMLGDVAMGNGAKLQSLTLAFAQMSSAGRLTGQDLLQMINQGFNPLGIISEQTGRSMAELRKEMEAGRISSQMVEDAFRVATSEGGRFYGMMDRMATTGAGKMSTFLGQLQVKLTELAERLNPVIGRIMDVGIAALKHFDAVARVIWAVLIPVRALATGLHALAVWFNENRGALVALTIAGIAFKLMMVKAALAAKGWTIAMAIQYKWLLLVEKAQKLLNITMLKNPVLAVVAAVSLLVGAFVMLRRRSSEANQELDRAKKLGQEWYASERKGLEDLFGQLARTNAKSKERNRLVDELMKRYPGLNREMENEIRNTDNLSAAKEVLINNLVRQAMAEGIRQIVQEKAGELARAEMAMRAKIMEREEAIAAYEERFGAGSIEETKRLMSQGLTTLHPRFTQLPDSRNLAYDWEYKRIKKSMETLQRLLAQKGGMGDLLLGDPATPDALTPDGLAQTPATVSDLTGGGARPTNITINLRSLIEYLNMYPQTVREGVADVEGQLIEGLLRVVNSANRIAVR